MFYIFSHSRCQGPFAKRLPTFGVDRTSAGLRAIRLLWWFLRWDLLAVIRFWFYLVLPVQSMVFLAFPWFYLSILPGFTCVFLFFFFSILLDFTWLYLGFTCPKCCSDSLGADLDESLRAGFVVVTMYIEVYSGSINLVWLKAGAFNTWWFDTGPR